MAPDILMVTAEACPLAKTGGLADAVSGLVRALRPETASVRLLIPAWPGAIDHLQGVHMIERLEGLPGGPADLLLGHCSALGISVLLLRNDALFQRPSLYVDTDGKEYGDNAQRFAALSMAAALLARGVEGIEPPGIVHCHDWHAALTPVFMRMLGVHEVKSILTLHNLAFQGIYPLTMAPSLGLPEDYCTAEGLEFWGQLNFLKGGLRFADHIAVVSHNYAREILTPDYGCGLHGLLNERVQAMSAIPNGIDTSVWDPTEDVALGHYSFSPTRLANKTQCKRALQQAYRLDVRSDAFLLAMGSRLTSQKMADVAVQALPLALDRYPDLQVCVMGHGDHPIEEGLRALAERYPQRCGVYIGYDETRAHRLHAGADALLHGSRFEPFGLTPLYAMRYGTIPIGSRVGGMVDTIVELVDAGRDIDTANGVLFEGDRPTDMVEAIGKTLDLWRYPVLWRRLQRNAMRVDMGWQRMAPAYVAVYRELRPDLVSSALDSASVPSLSTA